MTAGGFRCLYPNGGAFGFPPDVGDAVRSVGWIGPPDSTIRPARPRVCATGPAAVRVDACAPRDTGLAEHLRVPAWVMPKSHWSYELDFGSHQWMPDALRQVGVDPAVLAPMTSGAAIEFATDEAEAFTPFVETLLTRLLGSDFMIAWPGRRCCAPSITTSSFGG